MAKPRQFLFIFWILLGFFVLYIFSLNVTQVVNVDLFFVSFEQTNLVFVMFVTLFIGFVLGALTIFVKFKKENLALKKHIKTLQSAGTGQEAESQDQKPENLGS